MAESSLPEKLADTSDNLMGLYSSYEDVRRLTQHLNGLPDSAPIPATVRVDKVKVYYRVGSEAYLHTAEIAGSSLRVGDLYKLLAREAEELVGRMRECAQLVRQQATTIEAGCTSAQYTLDAKQAAVKPS